MLAVLRDLGLEKYVEKGAGIPMPKKEGAPSPEEAVAISKWKVMRRHAPE